jgi:hypothetical protein
LALDCFFVVLPNQKIDAPFSAVRTAVLLGDDLWLIDEIRFRFHG